MIRNSLFRAVATAAILAGGVAIAMPTFAASPQVPATESAAPAKQQHRHHGRDHSAAGVEKRITHLHAKLGITAAQEPQWNAFAQVMRDNNTAFAQQAKARHEKVSTMSAVDDMQSFQQMAQLHADGLAKLNTAFRAVYDSMSPDQQKQADAVFHARMTHHGKRRA
jgi:hypothetical protein